VLAHELRNPLAPVRNAVEILRRIGPADADLQWARELIDRQIQQMTRLIDELLDVSRINLGKIDLKRGCIELAEVVRSAVEASRPLIDERGHQLTISLPPQPVYLHADLTRLAQALCNLLNNAARYTDRGGRIELRAEREGSDAVVRVRDTGVGIPRDMLTKVFELFTQVDRSLEKSQGGLGVGLALVKRMVELHGGRVEAYSVGPHRGSEFVVRLPTIDAPAVPAAAPAAVSARANSRLRRVLVVDDNHDAADSLAVLLRLAENEVRTAYDGVEALRGAKEFRPHVVLLDIGMPNMNGYDAARAIRRASGSDPPVLIAITGLGQEADRRRSKDAGFDHHLVKPVDPHKLLNLLASLPTQTAARDAVAER